MKNTNNLDQWVNEIVTAKLASEKEASIRVTKEAVGNTRQDLSRPVLENLFNDGYTIVRWDSGHSTHSICIELNNQQWTLADFLSGLQHDAPIFERSHPGDISCTVIVMGDNLPNIRVDSYGNLSEE